MNDGIVRRYYIKYSNSETFEYFDIPYDSEPTFCLMKASSDGRSIYMAHEVFYIEGNRKIYYKNRGGVLEERISNKEKTLIYLKSKQCEF